ncbi:MAG: DUF3606 domain-containing protein [Variovorax sp.]
MITTDRPFVRSTASAAAIQPRFEDEASINVTALQEVDRWADALGVTEAELRIAVAAVGVSAQDVREHLGK